MQVFKAIIKKFDKKGEKTSWNYIEIPADISEALIPGNKKSFRVKGLLDKFAIEGIALLPMGGGEFIMAINAEMRKGTHKATGGTLSVRIEVDKKEYELSADFMLCLEDEPRAYKHFKTLPKSHQNYFSKWIDAAKTDVTKSKRIAQSVQALSMGLRYSEMIRMNKRTE
jgi:hypothetical protein